VRRGAGFADFDQHCAGFCGDDEFAVAAGVLLTFWTSSLITRMASSMSCGPVRFRGTGWKFAADLGA
jgi:hypothetical protein